MIINLPNTNTSKISAKIDELHEERGESATGRVLTLIDTTLKELENALGAANAASREHPCRVIAIVRDWQSANASLHNQNQDNQGNQDNQENQEEETPNLDAQVRFGADAGAGEIITHIMTLFATQIRLLFRFLFQTRLLLHGGLQMLPKILLKTCLELWQAAESQTLNAPATLLKLYKICEKTGLLKTLIFLGLALRLGVQCWLLCLINRLTCRFLALKLAALSITFHCICLRNG